MGRRTSEEEGRRRRGARGATMGVMDAVTQVPQPQNEPVLHYAPGSAERARLEAALDELAASPLELTAAIGGKRPWPPASGSTSCSRTARHVLGARPPTPPTTTPRPRSRRRGRPPRLAGPPLRRPGRRPPEGRRPARRAVAGPAQRRDDARPVQDRLPGRDRLGLRADRLLALQRRLRPADPRRAADLVARRLEPDRPPPARGLRLRGHAVQLHRDRRQPADRAGPDGQHRRVEAGPHPAARRAPADAPARGGRPAARRHQHGHRRRRRDLRGGARRPRPRRHPLHRVDPRLPAPVAHGRREHRLATGPTRGWSARPAARTSSSPTRAPTSTCCAPR